MAETELLVAAIRGYEMQKAEIVRDIDRKIEKLRQRLRGGKSLAEQAEIEKVVGGVKHRVTLHLSPENMARLEAERARIVQARVDGQRRLMANGKAVNKSNSG
jgi:DNA repair exonuclease SbcCD ATPase subunit